MLVPREHNLEGPGAYMTWPAIIYTTTLQDQSTSGEGIVPESA
jgi:hypothetical protein